MSSFDPALTIQFQDQVHIKSQQMKSRFRNRFKLGKIRGNVWAYDGLGDVEAREIQGRVQPVQFTDIEHNRRKIVRRRFEVTLPIDSTDVRGALLDPVNDYAGAVVKAMARVYDRVGIEAAFADVYTGQNMDTAVTFANDGGQTVDATAGLTYEKLLEIKKNFTNKEVGTDMDEQVLFSFTGTEEEALMKEIELISGDYTRNFVVENGTIAKGLGMDFITFGASVQNPLLDVTGGVRSCIAASTRGIQYGMSLDLKVDVADRKDLIEVTQVQAIIELGAVRTEGVLLQKVTTTA